MMIMACMGQPSTFLVSTSNNKQFIVKTDDWDTKDAIEKDNNAENEMSSAKVKEADYQEMNDESVVGADYFDDLFPLAEETGFEEQLDHDYEDEELDSDDYYFHDSEEEY